MHQALCIQVVWILSTIYCIPHNFITAAAAGSAAAAEISCARSTAPIACVEVSRNFTNTYAWVKYLGRVTKMGARAPFSRDLSRINVSKSHYDLYFELSCHDKWIITITLVLNYYPKVSGSLGTSYVLNTEEIMHSIWFGDDKCALWPWVTVLDSNWPIGGVIWPQI